VKSSIFSIKISTWGIAQLFHIPEMQPEEAGLRRMAMMDVNKYPISSGNSACEEYTPGIDIL
jgi:hypothetical protein